MNAMHVKSLSNPLRECTLCCALHHRKHKWCGECWKEYVGDNEVKSERGPGAPPPPPPGFSERDLQTGRPLL